MIPDGYEAARLLHRVLAGRNAAGVRVPGAGPRGGRVARMVAAVADVAAVRAVLVRAALGMLARSATLEQRQAGAAAASAVVARDYETARAVASTARRRPDLRAEKIVSRRYRFLWICIPKVASRSLLEALLSADPDADLIEGSTIGEIFAACPDVRGYYSFAFMRHPGCRALSFWGDQYVRLAGTPAAYRDFIEPYHGVREGMPFAEFCRWLDTPYGSDAFANCHWLSQHRQIRLPGGGLPDYIGCFERLDADWQALTARLGLPPRTLPRLRVGPASVTAAEHLHGETAALLRRRYAKDFLLGGYDP